MVSKNLPVGNTSQILIFGVVCQGKRIFVYLSDYLDHSEPYGTRAVLPRYNSSCMVYGPNGIENKNIVKYPYPSGIKKNVKTSL